MYTDTESIVAGAEQLSAMADKVAGFAISADLLLIFACLKDLAPWVKSKKWWFVGGVLVAGAVYCSIVWLLHFKELNIVGASPAYGLSVQAMSMLNYVGELLVWSRTGGIVAFTFISILAVLGTAKGYDG